MSQFCSLVGHAGQATTLAARGDGLRLASGGEDKTVRVWDLNTCKAVWAARGFHVDPGSVTFLGHDLVIVGAGPTVYGIDTRSNAIVVDASHAAFKEQGFDDDINSVALNASETLLATGDDSGAVGVIDLRNRKILRKMRMMHENVCHAVKFRPHSSSDLWSGGFDNKILRWDVSKGTPIDVISSVNANAPSGFNPPFPMSLATSSNGLHVAAGLGDGSTLLLNTCNSEKQRKGFGVAQRFQDHSWCVTTCSFLPKGDDIFVSGGLDGRVVLRRISETSQEDATAAFEVGRKLNALVVVCLDDSIMAYICGPLRDGSAAGRKPLYVIEGWKRRRP